MCLLRLQMFVYLLLHSVILYMLWLIVYSPFLNLTLLPLVSSHTKEALLPILAKHSTISSASTFDEVKKKRIGFEVYLFHIKVFSLGFDIDQSQRAKLLRNF